MSVRFILCKPFYCTDRWLGALTGHVQGVFLYTQVFYIFWTDKVFPENKTSSPGGSDGKEFACSARDLDSILGLGRYPGGGHGNPLQYPYLENPMDRGARQSTVHGVAKSRTWQRLSTARVYSCIAICQDKNCEAVQPWRDNISFQSSRAMLTIFFLF